MLGERLADMADELERDGELEHVSVKEAVLPFGRFPSADAVLGPEMKSTGEVMGVANDYPAAFGKAQAAAGAELPDSGTVFISVTDSDKAAATQLAAALHDLGFEILATGGTATAIRRMGVPVERIPRSPRGRRTSSTGSTRATSTWSSTRRPAPARAPTAGRSAAPRSRRGIPCITTMTGATAAQRAILARRQRRAAGALAAGAARPDPVAGMTARSARGQRPPTRLGAYVLLSRPRRAGATREPGQFYMLAAAERWGGGAGERPYLPRAFSHARAHEDGTLDFLLEAVGPGTQRLAELQPGDGLWLLGPLGIGFTPPGTAAAAARRRRHRRRAAALPARADARTHPVLLGFRSAAHAEAAACSRRGAR